MVQNESFYKCVISYDARWKMFQEDCNSFIMHICILECHVFMCTYVSYVILLPICVRYITLVCIIISLSVYIFCLSIFTIAPWTVSLTSCWLTCLVCLLKLKLCFHAICAKKENIFFLFLCHNNLEIKFKLPFCA